MSGSIYRYSGWYWLIAGLLFPLFIYSLNARKYNNSEFVNGKVIRQLEGIAGGMGDYSTYYYPQYEFQYNDSTYYSAREGFDIRDFPVGSEVKIYFPKGNPKESSIYTFLNFWLANVQLLYYIFIAGFLFALPKLIKTFIYDLRHLNE
jgi:hypothetical protein